MPLYPKTMTKKAALTPDFIVGQAMPAVWRNLRRIARFENAAESANAAEQALSVQPYAQKYYNDIANQPDYFSLSEEDGNHA